MLSSEQINWLKRNVEAQNFRAPGIIDFEALVDKINTLSPDLNCPVCDRKMYASNDAPTGYQLTIEHITPVSKGGTNEITNLFPLCGSCNSSKKDKFPEEWEHLGTTLQELNVQYHPEIIKRREIIKFDDIPIGQYFWNNQWIVVDAEGRSFRKRLVYEKISPITEDRLKYEIVEWHSEGGYIREIARYDREQDWYLIDSKEFLRPNVGEIVYKQQKFGNVREGAEFTAWSREYVRVPKVKKTLFIFNRKDTGCNARQLDNGSLVKLGDGFLVVVPVGELKKKVKTLTSHFTFAQFSDIPIGGLYTYWPRDDQKNVVYQKIKPVEIGGCAYDRIRFDGSKTALLAMKDDNHSRVGGLSAHIFYVTGNELISYTGPVRFWGRLVRFEDIKENQRFCWSEQPSVEMIKQNGRVVASNTGKVLEGVGSVEWMRYLVFDIDDPICEITPLADTSPKLKPKVHQSTNIREPKQKVHQPTNRQKVGFGTIETVKDDEEIDNLIREVMSQAHYTEHHQIRTQASSLKPGDKFEFIWRGTFYKGIAICGDFFGELCILFVNGKRIKAYLDGSVQIKITEKAISR